MGGTTGGDMVAPSSAGAEALGGRAARRRRTKRGGAPMRVAACKCVSPSSSEVPRASLL